MIAIIANSDSYSQYPINYSHLGVEHHLNISKNEVILSLVSPSLPLFPLSENMVSVFPSLG